MLDSALSPDRMEAALDAAGIGVWEMDWPGRRFTCSARCKQLFGLAPEGGVELADVLGAAHPEDRAAVEAQLDKALDPAGDGRFAVEHRVLKPDGQVRWVRSTGLAVFDEGRTRAMRFQGITKDITGAHARALARQQHIQEFEFLAESVPEIIWMAQADGAVTYFNHRWMSYTGQTTEQALNWGWEHVIHPADLPRCLQRWTHSLQTGEPYEVEYRFRRHDGEFRWYLGRALALKDDTGKVLKWFGTCTDIHVQKQTEQALRQREDDLARAYQDLEAKVTFRTMELENQVQQLQEQLAAAQRIVRNA